LLIFLPNKNLISYNPRTFVHLTREQKIQPLASEEKIFHFFVQGLNLFVFMKITENFTFFKTQSTYDEFKGKVLSLLTLQFRR